MCWNHQRRKVKEKKKKRKKRKEEEEEDNGEVCLHIVCGALPSRLV